MGRPGDFQVLVETRMVGDKHIGVGTGFYPRKPLRHERGIDRSNDARVVQLVGQLCAVESTRMSCNSRS